MRTTVFGFLCKQTLTVGQWLLAVRRPRVHGVLARAWLPGSAFLDVAV